MKIKKIKPLTKEYLEKIDLTWHTNPDKNSYISNEVISISREEANQYYEATQELYTMFVNATDHVINNNLFKDLDIPEKLIEIIKDSWNNEQEKHLYGRFDLSGGIDNKPIKLIEFNADTPTLIYETSLIQWALLKYNNYDNYEQFNSLYEALTNNFKKIAIKNLNYKEIKTILFSCIEGDEEELLTTKLLESAAIEAGITTDFAYANQVEFSKDGISKNGKIFDIWFKLIPWEEIAEEEQLLKILTDLIKNKKIVILNPAYTLIYQSKGLLKVLWDLYPNHPYLLETDFKLLNNRKQVEKVCFGREGANIKIINADSSIDTENNGEYSKFKSIYQEYTEFLTNNKYYYQAGLFYVNSPCALSFRKGGKIIDEYSEFVSHEVR